jgi:hypothetical protein
MAIDAGNTPAQPNPASATSTDMSAPATPAVMALPANTPDSTTGSTTGLFGNLGSNRKFYTISVSLREIYDSNVNTTNVNPQASWETEVSPSILVDFPTADSDFSARYTLNATYYSNYSNYGSSNNNNNSAIQFTHELNAQYMHSFSDRFKLNLAEDFRYYTDPSLFESTGTNYNNGPYVSNTLNGTFTAQWTPLFSTTTTYANTIVRYDDAAVADGQNSVENTGSETAFFSISPKVNIGLGGTLDNITYDEVSRGYTSYTGYGVGQWTPLPSLSINAEGGGSYTEVDQGQGTLSPYAALAVNWTLGARSSLSFNYLHDVVASDNVDASGEIADRLSANFNYDITSSLSAHLQGVLTLANISSSFIYSNATTTAISGYNENSYALDTGLTYHYNSYLNFDCGVTLSGVSSDIEYYDYTRDETYVGVRGTY